MRSCTVVILGFVLTAFLLCSLSPANVEGADLWPKNRGEVCWDASNGGSVRLFVTNMGKNHYIVNGTHSDPPDYIVLLNGNAEIIGDRVIMHITSSSSDADTIWGYLSNADLDKATLNGIVDSISYHFVKTDNDRGFEYDGEITLTHTSCP